MQRYDTIEEAIEAAGADHIYWSAAEGYFVAQGFVAQAMVEDGQTVYEVTRAE